MKVSFKKYHGCGNDFILLDNTKGEIDLDQKRISELCHRHFGIGSDGIILIELDDECDYYMRFYNPDGSQSFCGNGSRCALHFSYELGMVNLEAQFRAIDGMHKGILNGLHTSIKMKDVQDFEIGSDYYFIDTGSPHYVVFVEDLDQIDVYQEGRAIRYNERFREVGTNVNFVEIKGELIRSRVYERGVENETFSSGTGSTAQAISCALHQASGRNSYEIQTRGGNIQVSFKGSKEEGFSDIWLKGFVSPVFEGEIEL